MLRGVALAGGHRDPQARRGPPFCGTPRAGGAQTLSAPVQDLDAIAPNEDGGELEALAKSVHESILANEPEAGLDRLHGFVVRIVRTLCRKEGIDADCRKAKKTPRSDAPVAHRLAAAGGGA